MTKPPNPPDTFDNIATTTSEVTESAPAPRLRLGSFHPVENPLLVVGTVHNAENEVNLDDLDDLVAALEEDINDQLRVSAFDRSKLLVQTLLFAAVPVTARFLIHYYTGWNGFIDLKDIGLVYTGLFFTAGVLFSGVLSELKEAEKMPQEMANTLEWIEDIFLFMLKHADNPDMRQLYRTLIRFIVEWKESVHHGSDHKQCLTTLSDIVRIAAIWDSEKHAKAANGIHFPLDRARRLVSRAAVISKTDVLPSAHALQQFFVLSSTLVLFFASYSYWQAQVMIMLIVYTVTWFNLRLISFADDPFVTEIPLGMSFLLGKLRQVHFFPLDEYATRCIARHQQWCEYKKSVHSPQRLAEKILTLTNLTRRFVPKRVTVIST